MDLSWKRERKRVNNNHNHSNRMSLLKISSNVVELQNFWQNFHIYIFYKYNKISIYDVCFMTINFYYQVKMLINFWCWQDSSPSSLIQWHKAFRVKTCQTDHVAWLLDCVINHYHFRAFWWKRRLVLSSYDKKIRLKFSQINLSIMS